MINQLALSNTELIPEAPNRQPIFLNAVVSVRNANVGVQGAVPSIPCNVLCRTPPVTIVANEVVINIAVAVPARKRRK